RSSTVQLLVDPWSITSWGHFSGMSFTIAVLGGNGQKSLIRPLSTDNPGIIDDIPNKLYRNPAPAVFSPKRYGLQQGPQWNPVKPAAEQEKDAVLDPDYVLLLGSADFGDALLRTRPTRMTVPDAFPVFNSCGRLISVCVPVTRPLCSAQHDYEG